MSALALAAGAAAAPGWVAWLSIPALVVSIATVVVTVSLWRRDGWRLAVTPLERVSEARDDEGRLIRRYKAKVTNVGRMPCIVADVEVRKRGRGFLRSFDPYLLRFDHPYWGMVYVPPRGMCT
jgi:hypothetical protein